MKQRKSKLRQDKERIIDGLNSLEAEQQYFLERCATERIDALKEFRGLISNPHLTWEEQNELYKTLIDYIVYTRLGDETYIQIVYK